MTFTTRPMRHVDDLETYKDRLRATTSLDEFRDTVKAIEQELKERSMANQQIPESSWLTTEEREILAEVPPGTTIQCTDACGEGHTYTEGCTLYRPRRPPTQATPVYAHEAWCNVKHVAGPDGCPEPVDDSSEMNVESDDDEADGQHYLHHTENVDNNTTTFWCSCGAGWYPVHDKCERQITQEMHAVYKEPTLSEFIGVFFGGENTYAAAFSGIEVWHWAAPEGIFELTLGPMGQKMVLKMKTFERVQFVMEITSPTVKDFEQYVIPVLGSLHN